MDFLLLLLQIELVLITLLFVPILMTRYHLSRRRPLKALAWAKFMLNIGRVLPTWRGIGNSGVAACYIQADDFAAAQPYAERAAAYYEENTAKRLNAHRAVALANLGITLSRSGQMEQAEQSLDAALKIGVRNPAIRAMTEIYAANVYLNRGRLTDAARLMEAVLVSPKISEDYRVSAENLLAMQKYFMEDFAGGLALARQAMQRKASLTAFTIGATITAQDCLMELGDLREAQTLEAGILAQIAEAPRNIQASALRASATLALKLGNLDRAREQAERAAALHPTPNAQASALLIQAEVFALRQNFQRAASLADAVLRSEAIDFYKRRARALQSRLAGNREQGTGNRAMPPLL